MSISPLAITIEENDFRPVKDKAERRLVITGAGSTLFVSPDNPLAGAVVFLNLFDNDEEACISLDYRGAEALHNALGALLAERRYDGSEA